MNPVLLSKQMNPSVHEAFSYSVVGWELYSYPNHWSLAIPSAYSPGTITVTTTTTTAVLIDLTYISFFRSSFQYIAQYLIQNNAFGGTARCSDVLLSRDTHSAQVWCRNDLVSLFSLLRTLLRSASNPDCRLVATLGLSKTMVKKIGRKDILSVDVPKACTTVVNPEVPLALRLQSGLLIGISR
jgi:hypothetical protein